MIVAVLPEAGGRRTSHQSETAECGSVAVQCSELNESMVAGGSRRECQQLQFSECESAGVTRGVQANVAQLVSSLK